MTRIFGKCVQGAGEVARTTADLHPSNEGPVAGDPGLETGATNVRYERALYERALYERALYERALVVFAFPLGVGALEVFYAVFFEIP